MSKSSGNTFLFAWPVTNHTSRGEKSIAPRSLTPLRQGCRGQIGGKEVFQLRKVPGTEKESLILGMNIKQALRKTPLWGKN